MRLRAIVFGTAFFVMGAAAAEAQRPVRPDSTRRMTAEEYQAARRAWLEARRMGAMVPPPPVYGSAVVGPRQDGRPGRASGTAPGLDGADGGRGGWDAGRPGRASGSLFGEGWSNQGGRWGGWTGGPGHDRDGAFGPGYPGGPYGPGPFWPGYSGGRFGMGPFGQGNRYGYAPGYPYAYPGAGIPGYGLDGLVPPWAGVTPYAWTPWGYAPEYPFALPGGPGGEYRFGWPGYGGGPGSECAEVSVLSAGGLRYSIRVAPLSLGLSRVSDLDLAIDARLSQGYPVMLYGIDGRVLRLDPGPGVEDVRVIPCRS